MAAIGFTMNETWDDADPDAEVVRAGPWLRPVGNAHAVVHGLDSLIATVVQLLVSSVADEPTPRRVHALQDALERAAHVVGATGGALLVASMSAPGSSHGLGASETATMRGPRSETRRVLGGDRDEWGAVGPHQLSGEPTVEVTLADSADSTLVLVPIVGCPTPSALAFVWRNAGGLTSLDAAVFDRLRTLGGTLLAGLAVSSLFRRPSMDDRTGLADRRLFLIELGHQLALLAEARLAAVAVLWVRIPSGAADVTATRDAIGVELERLIGSTDMVATFDANSIVISLPGLPTAHDVMTQATELRAALMMREISGPTPVMGVAHTRRQIPAGVLLRQAEGAAHLALRGGDPVRMADGT